MKNDFVYYFVYGSNLSFERFQYYVKGGIYPVTGKSYIGCTDKNLYFDIKEPIKHVAKDLKLFFGQSSSSWGNQGVAFVEELEGGLVYGRLYLVTEEQFKEIQAQEGKSPRWYGRTIDETFLGYYDNIPIRTITCEKGINKINPPSSLYLSVIKQGLIETGYGLVTI